MLIDLQNIVSISDANRNFSQVARKVDQSGPVVIMKNNRPRYVVSVYNDRQNGGVSMRKLHYKQLTINHPAMYYELQLTQGDPGTRVDASHLTEKRASRQTQLFHAYVALYAAKRVGLEGARRLLNDQGDTLALETLGLPPDEDRSAMLAIWFCQALLASSNDRRVMALYNAYGALPSGYAGVAGVIRQHLGEKASEALMNAVAAIRYDEGDLADIAPERPHLNHENIQFDEHLNFLAQNIK